MKRLVNIAAMVVALVLGMAVPAFAGHDLSGTPCEIAHECTSNYAHFLPPGHDLQSPGLWGWDPAGNYGYQYVLWLAGYCTSQGGYYYETADGGYSWNAC